jgi:hypothetical protein
MDLQDLMVPREPRAMLVTPDPTASPDTPEREDHEDMKDRPA